MRFLSIIIVMVVLVVGCKKKEPKPPESVLLVFPEKNSECTTGQDISATKREVEFKWQASNNTESYELIVTNLNSGIKQNASTTATSAKLSIEKGTPFSWVVVSENTAVMETATSATWNFYNAGSATSYAPFPVELVSPDMGSTVFRDLNNEVELSWKGSDLDNDITGYEIYFSTVNPPEDLLFSNSIRQDKTNVSVEDDTVYYWKVKTIDREGNTSNSSIFEFKVF